MARWLVVALCLCVLSCSALPQVNTPIDIGHGRLPQGVTVINSVNASYPFNHDLSQFDDLARHAEIFAIGESSHGTGGYQDFQFRLSKYLITRFGYRRVLSEILSDEGPLNTYLTTGQGDLAMILYNNPWQGSDVNMFNFFSWIREFNAQHPRDMVNVYTVDPQNPWEDAPIIKAFLELYDAKYNQNFSTELFPSIYDNCFGAKFNNQIEWAFSTETDEYYACACLPDNKTATCVSAVSYVEEMVRSELPSLTQWLGETYVGNVLYATRSLRSWQEKSATLFSDTFQSMRYRESVFGQNVLWKASRDNHHKKSKSILIAHNLHICKTTLLPNFVYSDEFSNIHTAGYIISHNIGNKYVAVAQSGYNVTTMFASAPYPFPSSPLSIDVTLRALNQSYLLLNTNAYWVAKQGKWLVAEESVPNGRYYYLGQAFDRLMFHAVAPKGVFVDPTAPSSKRQEAPTFTNNMIRK